MGLMGVTRRMRVFDDASLQPFFIVAACGAALIAVGILAMLIQIGVSILRRESLRDESGDPWGGRTLEWATSSPPPEYNFAFTPIVHDLDAWDEMKRNAVPRPATGFRPIHMPRNTPAGLFLAGISLVFGFAMIWHIWWMAIGGLIALFVTAIGHTFIYDRSYHITAEAVAATEDKRARQLALIEGSAV